MSGHPEREGGEGGGATLQHGNPNSSKYEIANSRFRVSEFPGPLRGSAEGRQNPDSMFPSVQTPGYSSANSRFRVSEFPGPLRGRSAEGSQNPDSMFPHGQIPGYSSANSRFQDSECADSRILLGIFQIPSFRVSEAPSWVRAQGTAPKFQIPSFRVSEAPSCLFGPRQRRGTPKFQIPSFRVSEDPSWVAARGTHKFPDSKFPSLIPRACQRAT